MMILGYANAERRRPWVVLSALIALALLIGGCAGGGEVLPPDDVRADTSGYRLGSGDRVRIVVFGQENMTGEYQVDGSGAIAMPLIGSVEAGGLTVRELRERIESALHPDYLRDPNVSIEVIGYRPFYIVGEVNKPGSYPYVDGMTVINAVALAGGFTYRARENDFYITRANEPERRREARQNTPVLPGDVITVRERFF